MILATFLAHVTGWTLIFWYLYYEFRKPLPIVIWMDRQTSYNGETDNDI